MLASGLNVLRSFLTSEVPCDRVIGVGAETLTERAVRLREDGLLLYLPATNKKDSRFEIVLHKPFSESTFSLYRTNNLDEAEAKFCTLKDTLQGFIEICNEMYNLQGLQKICDLLDKHPSWNLAHVTAYFNYCDLFQHPSVNTYLNSSDDETGISPLQVAITTKNLKTVQTLVDANCSLEHLDHNLDSVFHYAAITTKEIIAAMTHGNPPNCLNFRNKNGYTPLHIACQADKTDCVRALLLAGADVNKTSDAVDDNVQPGYVGDYLQNNPKSLFKEDMKMGGTPLHWANSRPVIEALIDMNCHIDALNFDKKTALHVMVMRNRIECVVALLSRQADPNIGDAEGNRPIHLAAKQANVAILQCLIVFGVDLDVINYAGHSARHLIPEAQQSKVLYFLHAVGAKRCPPGTPHCTDGCKYGGTYDGIPPPPVKGQPTHEAIGNMLDAAAMEVASLKYKDGKIPSRGRLLCLDGGGIRGLVLVEMLLELETLMRRPICHCFDWVAGTSTGGILALGIASGKTMKECLCLYFRIKEYTFVGMRPYASEPLENVLKDTFGHETVMTDIKYPKVMITGALADRKPIELHLFRNYESPRHILKVTPESDYELPPAPEEQYVWQVGRATGAAPTYFRAFERYLDGGLIANNPTLDAISEIHEYNLALRATGREEETTPLSVVISLGTGLIPVTPVKDIDVYIPGTISAGISVISGLSVLSSVLVDQATASDGRVVDRARAWCSMIGVPYFRFSPQMSEEVLMNETSDEKLCRLLWETKVYMYRNANTLKEIATILNRG